MSVQVHRENLRWDLDTLGYVIDVAMILMIRTKLHLPMMTTHPTVPGSRRSM